MKIEDELNKESNCTWDLVYPDDGDDLVIFFFFFLLNFCLISFEKKDYVDKIFEDIPKIKHFSSKNFYFSGFSNGVNIKNKNNKIII